MDYKMARTRAGHIGVGEKTKVSITIATGTHHRLALFERTSEGRYEENWNEGRPSRARNLEIEAKIGSIVHQRTTSPASAEPLERYGVVLPEGRIDWGSDAGWAIDFGPIGEVTRRGLRSPTSSVSTKRGRIFVPYGEEVVGGAVSDAPTTSTD